MKRKTQINHLMWLILFSISTAAFSQQSNYTKQPGYWILGINGGLAYQQGDVRSQLDGFGLGLTLGKNLYYKPGAPFAFDARGRLLYTRTYGLEHNQSQGLQFNDALNGTEGPNYTQSGGGPGFVYQNHKTDLGELGLEGVLTFNQLRERTGTIFSLYGGIGLDLYNTQIDQLDENGNLYSDAYTGLNPNGSRSSIRNQLQENILDGTYETSAHGYADGPRLTVMPSVGAELGYQLGPKFSMGIGHRVTFARNDLLDGQQWNDNNTLTDNNDLHHYTSLHMRWDINPREQVIEQPQITIIDPSYNPYTAPNANGFVKARIKNVSSAMDVAATINGYPLPFDFKRGTFTARPTLETGANKVVITATNTAGTATETVVLSLKDLFEEPPTVDLPRVRFTNPPREEYRVMDDRFRLSAQVSNVRNKSDLRLTVNGRSISDFRFNSNSGLVEANIRLDEGRNTARITASNSAGTDQDNTSIIYDAPRQVPAPVVDITRPSTDPFRTDRDQTDVSADIRNIDRKGQIRVEVNGRSTDRFNFRNGYLDMSLRLREGRNIVRISAQNESGSDADEVSIYFEPPFEPPVVDAPVVRITDPSRSSTTVREPVKRIQATIRNVDRRADIRFLFNGRSTSNFDFDSRSQRLTATVNLREGDNEVRIEARNEGGSDQASVRIRLEREIVIEPKRLPTVRIISPTNGSNTSQADSKLRAEVRFVNSKSDIEVRLNGRSTSNFSYDSRSRQVTANLRLKEGRNTIRVIATNRDGRNEDEIGVTYNRRKLPPTVSITRPANNSTSGNTDVSLEADVRQVSSKSNITVELNGNRINDFRFDSGREEITASLKLREGRNTIRVKVSNNDGSDQDEVAVTYNRRKQPPTVSITRPASNSTSSTDDIKLEADVRQVSSKSDITVELNGSRINDFRFDSRREEITANVKLREGRNTIRVKVRNNDGSDQDEVAVTYNRRKQPPTVQITKPRDRAVASATKVSVNANIRNVNRKEDIRLELNGRSTSNFRFDSRRGTLTAELTLREGNNNIRVKASNTDGSDQDEVSVVYKPVRRPPVVRITKPRDGQSTLLSSTKLEASVSHVDRKEDIKVLVNGKSVSKFSFDAGSDKLTAVIKLADGNNKITIDASNKDGRDQASVNVERKVRQLAPTVDITTPKNNAKVNNATVEVKATVKRVNSKSELTFKLNGKTIKDFDLNGSKFTAKVSLRKGSNDLQLEAKTKGGSDSDAVKVGYQPALAKPTVAFTKPSRAGQSSSDITYSLAASTKNVTSKKDVDLYVNGKEINDFLFNAKSGKVTGMVPLKKGKNTFRIVVRNKAGKAEAETNVQVKSKVGFPVNLKKPSITNLTNTVPVVNPLSPNTARVRVTATIKNVLMQNQITFKLNGKTVTDFNFDTKTGKFSALIDLNKGATEVYLEAKNISGKTSKTKKIEY